MSNDVASPQAAETQPLSCCRDCTSALDGPYYTSNGQPLCGACYTKLHQRLFGGSRMKRVLAATALGLLAGIGGAIVWYAVRRVTGYEIGLIALAMGLLVGIAVRKGSGSRGGWFYQALAMMLTYGCICVQYVPDLVEMLINESRGESALVADAEEAEAVEATDGEEAAAAAGDDAEDAETATAAGEGDSEFEPTGPVLVIAVVLFLMLAAVFSLALPIVSGFENPIGLIIVGIALYEAWKINQREKIELAGPFQPEQAPPPVPVV